MSYISSKGWYVKKLKELGITRYEGYKLEKFKCSFLAHLYHKAIGERK